MLVQLLASPPPPPLWSPTTWRGRPAHQQPDWRDQEALVAASRWLARRPALVPHAQVLALRSALADVVLNRGFVLQMGDCAETFDAPTASDVAARLQQFREASQLIGSTVGRPVVQIGRMAGQYAKPRSSPVELWQGRELPVYRGCLVNTEQPDPIGRLPDARRLTRGHLHASAVLAQLRVVAEGMGLHHKPVGNIPALWTSHEALVLEYEEPQLRYEQGSWALRSTHFPWIGMRTCQPEGAHVEFLRGVVNPIGCKVGAELDPATLLELCDKLDPEREPGRLVLITRLGAGRVRQRLPALIEAVRAADHPVLWMCDPMHGNTFTTHRGQKTRRLQDILAEVRAFFEVLTDCGEWPGGLHLEATPADVTECLGGSGAISEEDLERRYLSACDPRLNGSQTMDVVRLAANLSRTVNAYGR
jgi:3-deoxy-7-phosphoheptulonate synthase